MPRLLVHASVECAGREWGGISSALALLLAASASAGQEVVVVSIGEADETVLLEHGQVALHLVGVPELRGTVLYQHPDRVRMGQLASERMAKALEQIRSGADIDLFVHNDELGPLVEMLSHQTWCRSSVAVVHGLARQEHPSRPDLHRLQDKLVDTVNAVAVFSPSYADTVRRFYPELDRLEVVRLPLALLVDEAATGPKRNVDSIVSHSILAAGRAVPQKGFDILMRALALVQPGFIGTATVMVGHGDLDYLRLCESIARTTKTPISMTGWATRADLIRAMVNTAAVIVPSRFEPLGLVAAEALARGVPVVASEVGGLVELIAAPAFGWTVAAQEGFGPVPSDLSDALIAAVSARPAVSPGPEHLRQWSAEACVKDLRRLVGA